MSSRKGITADNISDPQIEQKIGQLTDCALLKRVRRGDEQALATLYDAYSTIVYSVALRVLENPASAADVLHDVFRQIWRSPQRFLVAQGSFGLLVAMISRNRAMDKLRMSQRKCPLESVEDFILVPPHNTADHAEQNLLYAKSRVLIEELQWEQRMVLDMVFFEGMASSEIAAIMGCSPRVVKRRIRGALSAFKKTLQAEAGDHESQPATATERKAVASHDKVAVSRQGLQA